MQKNIFFRYVFKSISIIGAAILFSWGAQRIINKKNACQEDGKILKIVCYVQEVNKSINNELNIFTNTFRLALKGEKNLRNGNFLSKQKFKNYKGGFDFFYLPENGSQNGYLLLSRIHPDLQEPKIELWDLTKQEIIHTWPIKSKLLIDRIKFEKKNKNVLRFLHPLLLSDGSIITHIQPEHNNTELLKFDYCGNLLEFRADGLGYHHSIEIDDEDNIYIPIAKDQKVSKFYENYIKFPKNYRKEGIAIIDKNLVLKEVIPLDEIFNSIGLLEYINGRSSARYKSDPYHLNDVHPYKDDKGNLILLLSLRHFGLISYNYSQKKVDWLARGLTDFQHDISPYLQTKDIFTIFDNGDETNQSEGKFKGNTMVKIDFSRLDDSENPKILFGKSRNIENISIEVFDFADLGENQIPNTKIEGRGRFINEFSIFLEETNLGRAFIYNLKTKKLKWSYINKGKDGYTRFLGWSRYLDNIPDIFKNKNLCDN